MDQGIVPIKRALISVFDKTGVVDFAKALAAANVEILSTGGTAKMLRDSGIEVVDVSDYTGQPEMFEGRVKTLHPMLHGGLLFKRNNDKHIATARARGIRPIDLLIVNLYPFAETVAKGAPHDEIVENIDIGGPAMIRSAAKNCASVAVVVDPSRYGLIVQDIRTAGGTSYRRREVLAATAFKLTARYDADVERYYQRYIDEKY